MRRARAAVAFVLAGAALAGCSGAASNPYGSSRFDPHFPAFIPKKTLKAGTDRVLVGTSLHPALTSQGLAVQVRTPAWAVMAEVTGPLVPIHGSPLAIQSTVCTWTVTLWNASAPVPISLDDFDTIDHFGKMYGLSPVPGQPAPPPVVKPGQKVTFQVRTTEAVGEGILRWAPIDRRIVAQWDFIVEID